MARGPARLSIQPFVESDRSALLALWRRCALTGPEVDRSIDFALGRAHTTILIGKVKDGLVASVMVGHDGHVGYLYFVAVDPDHQHAGYGRAIVEAAETWLAAQRIWRSMLMIRQDNAGVVDFYQRLGWDKVPNIVMQKRLSP